MRFFSGKSSAVVKIALLQKGDEFAKAIDAQAASALARQTSAKVLNVRLVNGSKAVVTYTIELAGAPVLAHRTGTAVKVAGSWKVGDASFCALLRLQGSAPAAC